MGNGFCTFQVRGMEFKGTYCQEREIEAIMKYSTPEDLEHRYCGCCRNDLDILSITDILTFRWTSWEVINTSFVVNTYEVLVTQAPSMFDSYYFRMNVIKYFIICIAYFFTQNSSFESWITNDNLVSYFIHFSPGTMDFDPIFRKEIDVDYDESAQGVSLRSFYNHFGKWIHLCVTNYHPDFNGQTDINSTVVKFVFALSLVGRRALAMGASGTTSRDVFLQRFHALFKGDFRITSQKDEWIYGDIDLLDKVLAKAVRFSLQLHINNFTNGEDYDDISRCFEYLKECESTLVIRHETDPKWKESILNDAPELVSLRRQVEDNNSEVVEHQIIILRLKQVRFRAIKLNRESVRGLWTGQQQELSYLGNENSERGSIQQMKSVLRNLINQSCDPPAGYPIYVSPLATSFANPYKEVFKSNKKKPENNVNRKSITSCFPKKGLQQRHLA